MAGKTLYDKLWEMHEVKRRDDGSSLIYIDRHILHEVTSPQAFEGLRLAGRKPWRIDANIATPDHNVPTTKAERQGGLESIADPGIALAGADAGRELRRLRHPRIQDERQPPGHRACGRPGTGRHLAGHDRGLRRFAHLHPRRLRRAGARHRHFGSRACAGHPVPGGEEDEEPAGARRGQVAVWRHRQGHRAGDHRQDRHCRR